MIVILRDIRSLYNVGSIFRTADAAGVEKIYLCGITPEPVDRFGKIRTQLAKVSLGAEKTVAWEKCSSASRVIDRLKKEGYKILAIEQSKRAIPYFELRMSDLRLKKAALILGSETRGLTPSILKRADAILEIPMRGAVVRQAHHPRRIGRGKESLNVAVAFGIVAFQLIYG
ncbi:MAG: hypothetical protein A2745_01990 [Candidatus Harrisonbacteria bacterium RIFCSPHIGHO2_01_FULL_44_13]|uniref:tRNA/rRNA methyltransferase SpoU type domain-containing protein n=1 Tax=Candidatus Harrisonbacteria bacterium RIFCSPLOWO2_01_FULL_44_18 TaxID=1798407 RepID=A0A1G1ZP34_9BACT|nr:MAG: hypothetical protein A2745_01990 [Candidatus Harrisonbacteria bacterium RIFCSPHIGHO2_01_FULL_44_13]OGY66332.1 MAG: hypothetical protein A3A16_00265 [Candidatus Harrisonbacteria bacterium RIFCSPLOWO2_01_FULL_44_18]